MPVFFLSNIIISTSSQDIMAPIFEKYPGNENRLLTPFSTEQIVGQSKIIVNGQKIELVIQISYHIYKNASIEYRSVGHIRIR